MSKIRRANVTVPTPKAYVRSVLSKVSDLCEVSHKKTDSFVCPGRLAMRRSVDWPPVREHTILEPFLAGLSGGKHDRLLMTAFLRTASS